MGEYDGLERTEEKLTKMLQQVRQEEGYLVQALNDEVFTGNDGQVGATSPKRPATSSTAATDEAAESLLHLRKLSPPKDGDVQPGAKKPLEQELPQVPNQPVKNPAEEINTVTKSVPGVTVRSTKRYKRQAARESMERTKSPSNTSAQHLEANRHSQRREQRVLARQRLENALFAEDDDGDESSYSTS